MGDQYWLFKTGHGHQTLLTDKTQKIKVWQILRKDIWTGIEMGGVAL